MCQCNMKPNTQTIYIIDDDIEICNAMRCLFESVHFKVETFTNALIFLKEHKNHQQGCIIIDVRMPVMSGLELLEQLKLQRNPLPVIIITGYGDIPMAIRAMKSGALDFVLKPFSDQCLLDLVQKYLSHPIDMDSISYINERISRLSDRENQILNFIVEGKLNKEIAYELCISVSTVEAHRASIMKKMEAKNLAQLIKLYIKYQLSSTPSLTYNET